MSRTRPIRRRLLAVLALLGFLLPLPEPAPARDGKRIENGLLWEISRDGHRLGHLFGTFHLPAGGRLAAPMARAHPALDAARTAAFEVDFADRDNAGASSMMYFNDGRRLDSLLGEDLFALARRKLGFLGLSANMVVRMKPWAVGVLASLPEGSDREPMDRTLQRRAREAGARVVGLETVREQLHLFDSLPLADQIFYAEQVLHNLDELEKFKAVMIAAYLNGELEKILAITEAAETDQERRFVAWFRDKVLVKRNRRMLARTLDLLAGGGLFVAVGALHLPGAEGLVNLLRGAGYVVRPVK